MTFPTSGEIAAAAAEVRAEWSDIEESDRRYEPPIAAFYHVAALALGASEHRAWRLFLGREYRADGTARIPTMKRPRGW